MRRKCVAEIERGSKRYLNVTLLEGQPYQETDLGAIGKRENLDDTQSQFTSLLNLVAPECWTPAVRVDYLLFIRPYYARIGFYGCTCTHFTSFKKKEMLFMEYARYGLLDYTL